MSNIPPAQTGADEEAAIAAKIRAAILDQRLLPGTKLTEAELAEIFSSSRARVRRVLLSLAQEKIVTLFPARGAFVAAPTQAEANEVMAARRVVELGLLEQVEQPASPVPLTISEILAAERAAFTQGDRSEAIRLSGMFHVELARWLANAVVAGILQHLVLRTSLVIALYEPRDRACCLPDDHEAVMRALSAGDFRAATKLMRDHLFRIEARLDFGHRHGARPALRDVLTAASAISASARR
jgi:DNA-binding GntR family transcriptional regulator